MNIPKILNFFDKRFIIELANIFCINKERIIKDKAIKEIIEKIERYFDEHYIKKYLIAEEAKLMQKYYFKKKLSTTKNKKKINEYKNILNKLEQVKNHDEIIRFLSLYYLNDIAADFNPAFLIFFREACKIMYGEFVKNFKVIISDDTLNLLRNIQGKYPIFYLPNHISNADHIPIAFAINKKKLFHPVIVAGANLYRGVSKLLLPKLNVEKLRRDFITDKLKWLQNPIYKICFKEYNNYLWENNEPFLFYIEGGRSRDGRILEPKYGIISEIFNFIKEKNKTSYFVPITISYTIVGEDYELYESLKGKNITYTDLFKHLAKLNREYKKYKNPNIYVKILSPIKISPSDKVNYRDFSKEVINILRKNIIITPTYLLASILKEFNTIEIGKLEKIYNEKARNIESKNKFSQAIKIFEDRKIIKIFENNVQVLIKELVNQYANRIKYLT